MSEQIGRKRRGNWGLASGASGKDWKGEEKGLKGSGDGNAGDGETRKARRLHEDRDQPACSCRSSAL